MTDAELIRGVKAGNATLLAVLYARCLPSLWRYAYRRLRGDVHATEDLVSETFIAAIESPDHLDLAKGTLLGWMLGIARHKIAHLQRRVEPQLDPEAVPEPALSGSPDAESPPEVLAAAEQAQEVLGTLERLQDDERTVLEWKYLDGCSVREIAQRLGRTDKAVENLLYRARLSFRELYGLPVGPSAGRANTW